jgi:hypothetical protein
MVDVSSVPQGLKHRVGQAEHEDILDRLFPYIVIDSKDLMFAKDQMKRAIEAARALQVMAEWFFDDDADPSIILCRKACVAKLADDVEKDLGWYRAVVAAIR